MIMSSYASDVNAFVLDQIMISLAAAHSIFTNLVKNKI